MSEPSEIDQLFDSLLKSRERDTLDSKWHMYEFANSDKQGEFVKDFLTMVNTPREGPAYIVLGIHDTPETGPLPKGLDRFMDDAVISDQLNEKAILPRPRLRYIPLCRDGKNFAILEIPVQREAGRPFLPQKDIGSLRQNQLWLRRSSQKVLADGDDLMRVTDWFRNGRMEPATEENLAGGWEHFLEAVYRFEPGRHYLLIADRLDGANPDSHASIGLVPWLAVFDFDPESENGGLLAAIRPTLEQRRSLQLIVKGQELIVYPRGGTSWFFARGLAGRATTLKTGPFREWSKAYGRELTDKARAVSTGVSPAPVTAVVLWNNPNLADHLNEALSVVNQSFGEELGIVLVSSQRGSLAAPCERFGAKRIELSPRLLALGLKDVLGSVAASGEESWALPTKEQGVKCILEPRDQLSLSEELDLVHLGVGLEGDDSPEAFARGAVASWRDLHLHHDCDRDRTDRLRQQVEQALSQRDTKRINLYHIPGAGGTTVARRVVWDLHLKYPCAVLRRSDPRLTTDRLSRIYALTDQSVLLLIDGGDHSESSIDQLYDTVRSQRTPVVMLQVLRRFQPEVDPPRDFLLKAELTPLEADRFRNAYTRLVPLQEKSLAALAKSTDVRERTAFYFGLQAFGKDFLGLPKFVEARLGDHGSPQRKVLGFLAIAHRYAQQPLPANAFSPLLQLPRERKLDLRRALPAAALDLLVEAEPGQWRTAHHLIAEEILRQALCPEAEGREHRWKQALSQWAIAFADFLRGDAAVPGEQMLEVARRTFIFRDNAELLGTERSAYQHFSQMIEEIPSKEGRLELLRKLTEIYPEEAHFHAHLGRFCGQNMMFDEAFQSIERALKLTEDDHVLHHIRGMVMRDQVGDLIEKGAALSQVIEHAKIAGDCFAESRRWNPENEHGYISEIQLLIKVLDYAAKVGKTTVLQAVAAPGADQFLRESIDRAEELLDQVRVNREGEKPSRYTEVCRARLDDLFGQHTAALQVWDGLLSRRDVAKPPIRRQIIWTLLNRRGGEWGLLEPKELDRCFRLLDENFSEGATDPKSLRLWLRAIRYSKHPPSLTNIIERIGYWKANTNALDAAFYLYVLHMLAALEGSPLARADSERAIEACRELAGLRRNRDSSFEWLGKGEGVARLVHHSQLGEWSNGFWQRRNLLESVEGRIDSIDKPQRGKIELFNGQMVFFVPAAGGFHPGQDENVRVTCFLGFSYDGPRAWEVTRVGA